MRCLGSGGFVASLQPVRPPCLEKSLCPVRIGTPRQVSLGTFSEDKHSVLRNKGSRFSPDRVSPTHCFLRMESACHARQSNHSLQGRRYYRHFQCLGYPFGYTCIRSCAWLLGKSEYFVSSLQVFGRHDTALVAALTFVFPLSVRTALAGHKYCPSPMEASITRLNSRTLHPQQQED